MDHLVDCWKFLSSPPPWLKAWLERQFLTHLKAYDERVTILKEDIDSLKKLRYVVQHQVKEEVQRYNRGILNLEEVEDWIKEVNEIIIKYEKFIQDKDHEFAAFDVLTSGYLPKARIRLHLSKETFHFIGRVQELLTTTKHDTFSFWLGPPSMADLFENRSYESFPSRDVTMKNIKEALESPKVQIIGLHGSSGVGKTTLVKEIIREALQASEAGKLFDVVALANVTKNLDITKIQGQIAETLGIKLDEETDVVRAARIRQRLKNGKESALIILDDLWAELDLNMLGIPLEGGDGDGRRSRSNTIKGTPFENAKDVKNPANAKQTVAKIEENDKSKKLPGKSSSVKTEETLSFYKGCKVLLISERKEVLLNQMGEKRNFIYFVDVLNKKEAEAFFNKMAGTGVRSSDFEKLAAQIASKCNGLPMSIVTTARALKDQSRSVWDDTLRQFERGKLTGANDFSTRLSYDLLENEDLKDVFLLCARMGPDALIMNLVKYCIGLGFLQGIYTAKEAWDRVYALVGKLKVSGLLSDSFSSDHFTMSDTVRSAALSIASKEKHVFTMTKGKVDEWPDEDKLERYTSISLLHCDIIDGFPSSINCPRLRVFDVNNNDPRLVIPKNLFDGVKELRSLILTGINLSPFPSSIRFLSKLRMFCLEQCILDKDLSFIGELKNLRIFSLSGSDIESLPIELKHLTKLQIFDISNCSKLRTIPSNVISSLVSLEELYMRNTLIQWEVQLHIGQSKNASLSELMHLNQLTTLDMRIPEDAHFPKNLFFDKLHSYKIVIGDLNTLSDMDLKIPEKYEASKFLAIQSKDVFKIHSQKGIKMLFERVENLFLEDLKGVEDIFYSLNLNGFPYLKHLLIGNNSNIKSLIDPEERQHHEKVFPRLESLHLHNLQNLNKICSCKLSEPSFHKLKFVKINICSKLKNVFSTSVVRLLTVLETIEVSDCYALKEIVEVETQSNISKIEDIEFPELRSLTLQSLYDNFIGFYTTSSTSRDLFNEKVIVSKLERMVLSSINIYKIWSDQLSIISCFQNLIHLEVNGCWNLKYLISLSMAKSLVNLQTLFVSECEKMTNIFSSEQGSHAEIEGSIFPNLKNIKLSSMKRLIEIWNSNFSSNSFDKLDTLIIDECDKFVNVFPCHMEGLFRSLCNLRVANCKSMKVVFELDHKKCKDGDLANLRDVYLETLPKLEHVWKWSKAKDGILKLKGLQKIWIRDCDSLENVFTVSIARHLPSLENLVILYSSDLREIVAMSEDSKTSASSRDPTFEFPKLTTIKFSQLPILCCFYPGVYQLSCPTLNDLSIEFCPRLEPFEKGTTDAQARSTLISEEGINKLKYMQIEQWHTKSSSTYVGEGSCRRDNLEALCLSGFMNPEIVYSFLHRNPNLKSLTLDYCSFTCIVPLEMPPQFENMGVVPKLKILKLIDLYDLETIGFEKDIILERIQILILKNCSSLVSVIPSHVSLTHLTDLEVVSCDRLGDIMPPSVAKSLVQLNTLKVMKCESIEEIVFDEEDDPENAAKVTIVFSQLKVLELVSLKNLNCFSRSYNIFEFPSLEKLVVSACPKMEFFSKNVNNTPLLQNISVVHEKEKKLCFWEDDINTSIRQIFMEKKFFEDMDEMSLSEHHHLQQTWDCFDGDQKRSLFYSLKILKLEGCENLSCAIPNKILPHLKSLKELEVRNCNKVEVIFEKNDTEVTPSQLKNLTLDGLSMMKHVWEKNCQGNLIFQNLQQVFVSNCNMLQTLFPEDLAKNLAKLEKIEIELCEKLLEIIGKESNVAEKFVFPCLIWLDLYELPELTYFYSGICTVECHELHNLFVMDCPKLELYQIARDEGEDNGSSNSNDRQALFSDLMAICNLEQLTVGSVHILGFKSRLSKLKEKLEFLVSFRVFFAVDDNEEHNLLDILEKAPNLQDLCIERCKNRYLGSEHGGILGQLKTLTLTNVSELQSISFENSGLYTVCKKLLKLVVTECSDLTILLQSPTTVSFSTLKILFISECHELEYLFTASVVKVLVYLEEITVEESKKIKEIVAKEPDGTTLPGVIFKRLYWITLDSLLSLECFYSGNDTLQLPSLKQVDMKKCPEMEVFSRGEVKAESFRGIKVSSDSNDEPVFHMDINILVKRMVLLQMLCEDGIDATGFSEHLELREAWDGKLSPEDNWFYNMRTLKLDRCDFEHYAIPSNVLCHLKNLRELEIQNCKNVKVIFEMNSSESMETSQLNSLTLKGLSELTHVWEMNCQGILMFQNLRYIDVSDCKSMKALLPASLAKKLTMLETLEIESCHKLQEIFVKEEDTKIDATTKFVFPHLCLFSLDDLPELTSFYPEIYTMVCPKLNDLYLMDCYKLQLFQGVHPDGEGETSSPSINRQPLFLDFKAISIPEELSLNQKQTSVLRIGQSSFSNLKEIAVMGCHVLEYLFTLSTSKKLIHLEEITIKNCSLMRTLLAKDEDEVPQGVEFKRLWSIALISLSSLDYFYSGTDILQLPSLTNLEIRECPKMEVFSQGEINAKYFRGIQASSDLDDELVFHNDLNSSVKKIFLLQERLTFKDSTLLKAMWLKKRTVPDWGFCNLNKLIVEGCDFLSNVILPSHIIPYLSNLKILKVRKCHSVKAIFDYTKIVIEGSLSLPNLEKLSVENCDDMVEIISKDETDTEEVDQEIVVKFPKVTFLKLWNLCNVKCIYPGVYTLQWPMLKELHVMYCPMLKFFATELHSSPDSYSECQDIFPTNQQASVSLEQVTPCLEVLSLGKEEAKMIEQGILHVDLQEINSLVLQCFHDESDSFPFIFCSKVPLPSIQKLVVRHSAFKEIFPPKTSDIDCTKFLSKLITLELRSLSLVLIGIEQPWMYLFTKNLQTLLVRNCGGLKILTPSTVSFSSLTELCVKNCRGLKYLFTFATAKTLHMLTKLSISNCKSLKAIVAKEGDEFQSDDEYEGDIEVDIEIESETESESESESESVSEGEGESKGESEGESEGEGEGEGKNELADEGEEEGDGEGEGEDEDEGESKEGDEEEGKTEIEDETKDKDEKEIEGEDGIIFKKLEILGLNSLPKLGSFYSGTSILKFTTLKSVSFTKCINMKIFRLVDQLPEDLKVTKDEECQEGDVNSMILQPFEEEQQPTDLVS